MRRGIAGCRIGTCTHKAGFVDLATVIAFALRRITEDGIGLCRGSEARFDDLVAGVQIRMRCPGDLPESLSDLFFGGMPLEAERAVKFVT